MRRLSMKGVRRVSYPLAAVFLVATFFQLKHAAAEEIKKSLTGVLVSSSSAPAQSAASPQPEPKNTMRLRFVPKNPPQSAQTPEPRRSASVSVQSAVPALSEPVGTAPPARRSDAAGEEYALARSRQNHPLAVRAEGASPVKQVVGSPTTLDYSTPRTARVLDPGKAASSNTISARIIARPAAASSDS